MRALEKEICDDPRLCAAWWCAIVEPGDAHAYAIRKGLGEHDAATWVLAESPMPLPDWLAYGPENQSRGWDQAWNRWHERALAANPHRDLGELDSLGGRLVIHGDTDWPIVLDDLGAGAPVALWVRGTLHPGRRVSIVGSRAATSLGERAAADLGLELAERGVTIVSGGAYGIDICAHRGALAAAPDHGSTLAVMAGGVGHLYPTAHARTFGFVMESGAVISEVPPSWRPAKWRFLGRNRVIAALSQVTVVVEASTRSGALATARRAIDLNRCVGAVPGPVTSSSSSGCHALIREGATLIRNSEDVMEMLSPFENIMEVPLFGAPTQKDNGVDSLPSEQRRVWEALPARMGADISKLARACGLSSHIVTSALAHLELKGFVRLHQKGWVRSQPPDALVDK